MTTLKVSCLLVSCVSKSGSDVFWAPTTYLQQQQEAPHRAHLGVRTPQIETAVGYSSMTIAMRSRCVYNCARPQSVHYKLRNVLKCVKITARGSAGILEVTMTRGTAASAL